MSTALKRRRGTTAAHSVFTGLNGELTVDTDKKVVVVHDAVTAGGIPMARADHTHAAYATTDALATKQSTAEKNAADGYAGLDAGGKVAAAQLPSYVDDILEFDELGDFPATGEGGKIYVELEFGKLYRWSGSAYVEIVSSPGSTDVVTEGTSNLYFTAQRVRDAVLTGLSLATNAAISASDTVLSALGKLQKQITDYSAATLTFTNKRITLRVGSTTSAAAPVINTDNVDIYKLTAQAADITSFTTNLTGTPVDGDALIVEITGTGARAIAWGASFEASTVALPTTTVGTAMLAVAFLWNPATSKWRCVAAV